MTNQKIQITNYLKIQDNYWNFYELVKDYNNSDMQPAAEAIGKLSAKFSSLNLDIHKDAINIPELHLKSLLSAKQPCLSYLKITRWCMSCIGIIFFGFLVFYFIIITKNQNSYL